MPPQKGSVTVLYARHGPPGQTLLLNQNPAPSHKWQGEYHARMIAMDGPWRPLNSVILLKVAQLMRCHLASYS